MSSGSTIRIGDKTVSKLDPPAAIPPAEPSMLINILIVDDEAKNLTVLETVLENSAYRLVKANSAEEALLALVAEEFALLILDVRMPGTNGFELAAMIKERKKTASIPIIFLTAYYNEEHHLIKGYNTGAVDYLHKPINAPVLRSKVSVFADLYRKSRELAIVNRSLQVEVGERQKAEENLRELNNTLEARVVERTEELIANQAHLRQAAQTARLTYLEVDLAGREARPAENFLDVMGFEPVRVPVDSPADCLAFVLDHVRPDDQPRLETTFDQFLGGRPVGRVEYRVIGADLVERWIESHWSMHLTRDGRPSRIFFSNLDVSATKHSQVALKLSETRLRLALDSAELGSWSIALGTGTVACDARFHEISGTSGEPMHYEEIFVPIHPDDRAEVRRALTAAMSLSAPEAFEAEYRVIDGDNAPRWVYAKGRANLSTTESVELVLSLDGTVADVTRRKRAELELRRVNADLEQFAYSASHDLQEPLRNVAVFSQLLQESYGGKLDEDGEVYLNFIGEGARRTSALISDLLEYTQAVSTAQTRMELVDAEQVLMDVRRNLTASVDAVCGKITSGPLPKVCVRPRHLEQLLQNLIGNGLKYRRDDVQPHIHVSATQDDNLWQFSVQDNGIGIEEEHKNYVFGLFKRLHPREERYPGTGIGLAICVRVVESYGGRIWLESEVGEGTTFHFTLPITRGE